MKTLPSLVSQDVIADLIDHARSSPPGCFVEVGVYKGGTAQYLTRLAAGQDREIFLYDTFTGIPYQGEDDHHKVGDFGDANYKQVCRDLPYAHVIKGVFPESAVAGMGPVAFAHIDCDQYQAIVEATRYLYPRMAPGGILWYDDTTTLDGAKRALTDLQVGDLLPKPLISKTNRHYVVIPQRPAGPGDPHS